MKKLFSENWIAFVLGIALISSMTLAIRNNYSIERNHALQQQAELIKQRTQDILSTTMHGVDLGVRGYALTKDPSLLRPYNEAIVSTAGTLGNLDSLLTQQGYTDKAKLDDVRKEIYAYIDFSKRMVQAAQRDDMPEVIKMLKEDKGYDVWKKYTAFSEPLFLYEDALTQEALLNYRSAIRSNLFLQISILVLALPMLWIFLMRVRKERDARQALLQAVEKNDKQFVFNPGSEVAVSAAEMNDTSIRNVHQASRFIQSLATGDYNIHWEGLTPSNQALNKDTLAGNLVHLREQLQKVKEEDKKRNWVNEGLAKFSEIIRNYQHDMKALSDESVAFLTKYLSAQQAGLFVLEGEKESQHLRLASCYAFSRKKWAEKRVEIGQGLIGQTFLEGEVVVLKEIPDGYIAITSGLGDATPRQLIIVPFKHDTAIPAIIEIASFKNFEEHHITFLRRAGEYLASTIVNAQTTLKMKQLLQDASQTEEQGRQREEEMRQNMEELQATQEELVRKEKEMQQRISGVYS
jgi:CHASE3 domain sensor protein/putative methionine-R-sulfoxide reductase with GAF domain